MATDKLLILWDIKATGEGNEGYTAVILFKIETKCYLDLAIAQNRLVAKG